MYLFFFYVITNLSHKYGEKYVKLDSNLYPRVHKVGIYIYLLYIIMIIKHLFSK